MANNTPSQRAPKPPFLAIFSPPRPLKPNFGNGNFDPERPVTRAEIAKIVAKTLEYEATKIK